MRKTIPSKKRPYPYGEAGRAATKFAERHGKDPAAEFVVKGFGLYTLEWGAYYQGYLDGFGRVYANKRRRNR